jgi:hypothetical protein
VEDTEARAERKELSDGVWFGLNVVELGHGVVGADALLGVEGSSCVLEEVAANGSCVWTWAACSKNEVQT